jgi:hypothetical protein
MIGKILFPCAVVLAVLASACDDELPPEPEDGGLPPPPPVDAGPCTTLTYVVLGKPLLDGKCVSCHSAAVASGGVRLDTLNDVRSHSDHVIEHAVELVEPAMPYNQAPLPLEDRNKLREWLQCGAP